LTQRDGVTTFNAKPECQSRAAPKAARHEANEQAGTMSLLSDLSTRRDRKWSGLLRRSALCVAAAVASLAVSSSASAQGLGLIRDTEIERLLNDYARPIFRAAGLGSQPIKVRIVKQDGFNAFVVDGQNVYVNTGMLMQSKTPNQVIGVIAHETGHIAGGHLAGLRQRIAQDMTKSLLLKVLAIGAMIGGASSNNQGVTGAGQGMLLGGDDIVMRGILQYRRQQESAADQAAMSYLNATKQSGQGMLDTFEEFARQEYVSAQYQDPYVRSHPMARDRIAQLREVVSRSPFAGQKDPPALQQRHDLVRAKLVGFLSDRNPKRVFQTYPESDTSLPAKYARAIASFFMSDVNSALPRVDALIRENPNNPYFHELKGEFLFRAGRAAEAVGPYRKALQLAGGDASLIRVQLGQALLADPRTKNYDEVVSLLRKAAATEGDSPEAFQHLATAYYKMGNQAEANLATAQSRFLAGNFDEAKNFARRAKSGLKSGSPGWLKADDIISYKPPKS
jgi:predicted Zn-dependent protease